MQKTIFGVLLVGVLVIGGWYVVSGNGSKMQDSADKKMDEKSMNKEVMEDKQMMDKKDGENTSVMKDETMMKGDDMKDDKEMMKEEMEKDESASGETETMSKSGIYKAYNSESLMMAKTGDVVLFFKASWCPSCRTVDSNIKANLSNIPESLTILEVDYDNSAELKKKYGVTTQHTFVQVDANGNMIHKWTGGATLESIVSEVK